MPFRDLREFIQAAESMGEVKRIDHADWNLEIGCLTELCAEEDGPLLLFDQIRGYKQGFRVASNIISTPRRMALALGLPVDRPVMDLVKLWRERLRKATPILPLEVADGPVTENVLEGKDLDVEVFPAPKWHERDGGRYIGTADMVVTRDPDSGWINVGTYRACIHGKDRLSLWILNVKHGRMIAEKYWSRGQHAPVAIVLGCEPATWTAAPSNTPFGVSEYGHAGYLRGSPVEVLSVGPAKLPVPAFSEIVLVGEVPSPEKESVLEGPFGEWPGYYAHSGPECVVRVNSVMYRDNPILTGAPPLRPTTSLFGIPVTAVQVWEQLERSGVTDVQGVWCFCHSLMIVISLKQRYAGHAQQALLSATGLRTGASMYRYVVVVDEDIDPANLNEVLWAICTRVDPETSIEILRGTWTSDLDPRLPPEKKRRGDHTIGRALVNACKPFDWKDQFPASNVFGPEMRKQIREKWGSVFE